MPSSWRLLTCCLLQVLRLFSQSQHEGAAQPSLAMYNTALLSLAKTGAFEVSLALLRTSGLLCKALQKRNAQWLRCFILAQYWACELSEPLSFTVPCLTPALAAGG